MFLFMTGYFESLNGVLIERVLAWGKLPMDHHDVAFGSRSVWQKWTTDAAQPWTLKSSKG
jgi:hypothetical protein